MSAADYSSSSLLQDRTLLISLLLDFAVDISTTRGWQAVQTIMEKRLGSDDVALSSLLTLAFCLGSSSSFSSQKVQSSIPYEATSLSAVVPEPATIVTPAIATVVTPAATAPATASAIPPTVLSTAPVTSTIVASTIPATAPTTVPVATPITKSTSSRRTRSHGISSTQVKSTTLFTASPVSSSTPAPVFLPKPTISDLKPFFFLSPSSPFLSIKSIRPNPFTHNPSTPQPKPATAYQLSTPDTEPRYSSSPTKVALPDETGDVYVCGISDLTNWEDWSPEEVRWSTYLRTGRVKPPLSEWTKDTVAADARPDMPVSKEVTV